MSIDGDHKNSHVCIVTDKPLNLLEGIEFVSSVNCGAINTFCGTIRDHDIRASGDRKGCSLPIKAIYYEAYESMIQKQLYQIIESTIGSKDLDRTTVVDPNSRAHVSIRLGNVPVKEASIMICVSSTSRHYSHRAVMTILERIKSDVAIWKKIIFCDGLEEWADESKSEASWLKKSS